jgi:lipid-A-disaccharide synthase-like uncharacterized protein
MFDWNAHTVWISIGVLGQTLFFMRFFVQWLATEKAGRSVVPKSFWFFSLLGGLTLFSYAVWRQDPVFMIGQGAGLFIYLRNIYFLGKEQREPSQQQLARHGDESSTYCI